MKIQEINSRDNPTVKAIKKLAQSNVEYKDTHQIWLEGEHLCDAFLLAKADHKNELSVQTVVLTKSLKQQWMDRLNHAEVPVGEVIVLPDALLAQISGLPSSGGLGFVVGMSEVAEQKVTNHQAKIQKAVNTIILDRIQDAGNVGSILRSAAVFGVQQVLALRGTAALWSPKVLRAGMGAHFALHLVEDLTPLDIHLDIPILATHVHSGDFLHVLQAQKKLPQSCAWVMGHEGQGISPLLLAKASQQVRIQQIGQESLNVAAAAAICLFASAASSAHSD